MSDNGDLEQHKILREDQFHPSPESPQGPQGPVQVSRFNSVQQPMSFNEPLDILCAACNKPIKKKPGTTPFKDGPYRGGYICGDCLILSLAADAPNIKDSNARRNIVQEAAKINAKRAQGKGEILFDEPEAKAWLTERGTILVEVQRVPFGMADEWDPDRFRMFFKAFKAVASQIPGYELEPPKT